MGNAYQSVLNHPNAVGMLLFLLDKGRAFSKQIQDNVVKNYDSVIKTASRLQSQGLVDSEMVVERRRTQYFWLTPKGEQVARKLREAEEILLE